MSVSLVGWRMAALGRLLEMSNLKFQISNKDEGRPRAAIFHQANNPGITEPSRTIMTGRPVAV